MTEEKVYTLFKESGAGPKFLTDISAKSLIEAKMKARIKFQEEELYLVDNTAFKRVKGWCKT